MNITKIGTCSTCPKTYHVEERQWLMDDGGGCVVGLWQSMLTLKKVIAVIISRQIVSEWFLFAR